MKRQLAFILAFEGKGELSQNTQNVMGKPLISWLLDTVSLTSLFYRVWVVTNCEKTKQFVAKKYGAKVTVYSCPEADEKFLPDLVAQMAQEGVLCVTDYSLISLQKYDKGYYPPSSIRIKEDKIVWCEKDSYEEIPIEDVIVIKYEKPYCRLFMKDRKSVLLKTGLAFWEHELPGYFIRINRDTLINAYHITFAGEEGAEYVVRDNKNNKYVVSKRKRKEVYERLRLWKGA